MKWNVILLLFVSTLVFGQQSDFSLIDFKKADSIAIAYEGESLTNLPVLTHKLTATLKTDVEKFRAIYTWVSTNIENDYSSYLKTSQKRRKLSNNEEALIAWNNNFTPKVFENLLKYKKTACTGYAYIVKELASLADINCKIVDGYGRTPTLVLDKKSIPNHSWNAVELNNKWYLCDATWSAGKVFIEDGIPRFKKDYFESYFLAEPTLFIKNHFPLKTKWALTSTPPKFNEFLEGPVIYKNAFKLNIIPITPSKMHLKIGKGEAISFILNSSSILNSDHIKLRLTNAISNKIVKPVVTVKQAEYILNYTFEKSGSYDVHILWKDQYIATYVIKVKRK